MNIFHLLDGAATRYPERPAIFRGDVLVASHARLRADALALAAAFSDHGVQGDRIVVAAKNCPEYIAILFGAWAAGMMVTPLNAKLHPREMAMIIEDAEPVLILAGADLAGPLAAALPGGSPVVEIGGEAYAAMLAHTPLAGPAVTQPDDLAWLFYTSGTTGRSKGAMLSHRNLLAMTIAHLADFEALSPRDSIIHAAPMSHGSGLYILPYVARAAAQIIPASDGFDPDEFLDLCDFHLSCGAFLAPTMVQRLRLAGERRGGSSPGLRSIVYGGGPMYLSEIKSSLAFFGPVFRQLYGQGESPMTITGLCAADYEGASDETLASVGWPRSGMQVRVVDKRGDELPVGEVGEIVCRGDIVMSGYWRDTPATRKALRGGWLYTGDMGSFDRSGCLTLRDRSKEVIISGGTNIYPREVEEVLMAHPAVEEVAVCGEPDEEWGESIVAFIALKPGAEATTAELDSLCISRIARFKRPKRYVFLPTLPKSSYGKILKRELKLLAEAKAISQES
ncbi:o-succinylbenzoate--CoA ligase [Sphingobium chlorophenolicum L-1]|uniref:3-methylmercaptopropionyl-CoA ligase n=1 Tax=Sphingobium chlorophenolicum L-1 TaxID=690566 RepID=F6F1P2_SPHCR|nr:AMP-binding protein [Sphingobium chlorophenolicum]AEG51458.1 o-succinylbenzoate--CoA ligase [Sphingobium chlorophenolicum L-1]